MKTTAFSILSASIALTLSLSATGALQAQDAAPVPAAGADAKPAAPDANTRRGNFNPEEFRQRMNERIKTSLKASDDEWKVLQPLIEKVQTAQRAAGGGGGFRGRPPGGTTGGTPATGAPATGGTTAAPGADRNRGGSPESQALRTALEDENSSASEIKQKLADLREARKKGQAELTSAREELRKVLSARQEAVLVSSGILD